MSTSLPKQYWMTLRVSRALDMIFSQFLSIDWKRFASCGICLAMSPEVKTASRYIHIAWTCTHCSRISETKLSLATHEAASSLNGVT